MIKILFGYSHTEAPWGGANNFIRALFDHIQEDNRFETVYDISEEPDIILFNQLSRGPIFGSKHYRLKDIREMKRRTGAKIVVRAINLTIQHSPPKGFLSCIKYIKNQFARDIRVLKLLNYADFVIFQSEYQKSFFIKWGYRGVRNTVIHNGADKAFLNLDPLPKEPHDPLKLIVSSINTKEFKRLDLAAKVSTLPDVEVSFIGNLPECIKDHEMNDLGVVDVGGIIKLYSESDYLLHPAERDVCPNSVIEALHFGLPVIYNAKEGSGSEIVGDCGVPIFDDDVVGAIELAVNNHSVYRERLETKREDFSIKKSASSYSNVFISLMKQV